MALIVEINPTSGKIGDLVDITATSGVFAYPLYNNNVVTFKGLNIDIIARIVRAKSDTVLTVIVPPDAITGSVTVENDVDEIAITQFEVIYPDIKFTRETKPYDKAFINNKVKTVGSDELNSALYNKDLSYSNFRDVYDENSLIQNIYTIILTQKGERLFSNFGTTIEQKIFSLIDDPDALKAELMEEIVNAIREHEPRVIVVENKSYVDISGELVNLILYLEMPRGNVKALGITLKSVDNISNI